MRYIEIMYPDLGPSARFRVRLQERAFDAVVISIIIVIVSTLALADFSGVFALFKPFVPFLMSIALLLAAGSLLVATLSSYLNLIISFIIIPIFIILVKIGEILNLVPAPNVIILDSLSISILYIVFKVYEHEKPGESFWWLPRRLAELENRLASRLTAFLETFFFDSER